MPMLAFVSPWSPHFLVPRFNPRQSTLNPPPHISTSRSLRCTAASNPRPGSSPPNRRAPTDWVTLSRAGRFAIRRARESSLPLRDALRAETDAAPDNPFVWHAAAVHESRVIRSRANAHHVLDAAMDAVPLGRRAALFLARAEILPDSEAVLILEEGIAEEPRHPPLYWALANVHGRLGDMQKARGVFEAGYENLNLKSGQGHMLRSWAVFEHTYGFPKESLRLWKQAVETDPSDPGAWRRLAEAEENCGGGQQASLKILRKAVLLHPRNPDLRISIAKVEERVNGAGAARPYLDDASFEGDEHVLRALALLEMREGNHDRARTLFRRSADLEALGMSATSSIGDGKNRSKTRSTGGRGARSGGNILDANGRPRGHLGSKEDRGPTRRRRRDFIGADPGATRSAKALHAWALMEVKLGRLDAARTLLHEADGLAPEDPAIWRAIAEIESREGNFGVARKAFERATAIDGRDLRLWLAWGKTELLAGNVGEAERLLLSAIERYDNLQRAPSSRVEKLMEKKKPFRNQTLNTGAGVDEVTGRGGKRDKSLSNRSSGTSAGTPYPNVPVQSRALAEALKELSSISVQQGDLQKAVELLQRATKADPSFDSAWRVLGEHVHRIKGIEAVRELFGRALKVCSRQTHGRLLHWWAMEERNEGCLDEARKLLERATKTDPDYMSAWLSWALVEKADGSVDRACEIFENAAAHAMEESVRSPYIFHAWGRVEELNRGDIEKARTVFRTGCQLSPSASMLLHAWGQLEDRCGRVDAARELFGRAVEAEPHNGFNWQAWGMLEARRRNYKRAAELFAMGSEKDPKYGGILASWGMMEGRDLGNVPRARELFEKATTVDPNNGTAWHSWGSLELRLDNHEKARGLYLQSSKVSPDEPAAWNALGVLEAEHNSSSTVAIDYFKKATTVRPSHAISYQAWALFVERRRKDVAEARRLYEVGIEECDCEGQAILYQAWATMEQRHGNISAARDLLKRGLDVDRRKAELWSTYALLEKSCGNRKAALRLFEDACSAVLPVRDVAAIYAAWGSMEAELGECDEARILFQRGLRINPGHAALWRAYASMEEQEGNLETALELRGNATGCEVAYDDIPADH